MDAWDRRRVLLFTQLMLAAGSAGLAANALPAHPQLWPLFACTAEAAAFQGLDWSARRASLRRLVPPGRPARRGVRAVGRDPVTLVAGPGRGRAADRARRVRAWCTGWTWPRSRWRSARCCCCRALPPDRGGQPASLASLVGGVRYLRSSQPLAGVFLIDLGAMVFGMPRALFPALAATVYGGGAATVGYLNAAPGVGALSGSLLTGRVGRVHGAGRAVAVCVVVWGLAITAFGLVRWLPAALALLAVAGAADVISAVFRMVIVQQVTPDRMQGRVNSLIYAGIQGGPRLGDAEAGAAAAIGGPQFAAWSGGLLSVATALATCWLLPGIWRYDSRAGAVPLATGEAAGQAGGARSSGPAPPGGWLRRVRSRRTRRARRRAGHRRRCAAGRGRGAGRGRRTRLSRPRRRRRWLW